MKNDKSVDIYDKKVTKVYIDNFEQNPSKKIINDYLATFFKHYSGKKILDLGCGSCYEYALAKKLKIDYYGIDLSRNMINICKIRGVKKTFISNFNNLSFSQNSFDAAICLWAIQYASDLDKPIKQLKKVIKKRGKLFLAVPHPLYKFVMYNQNYYVKGRQWEIGLGIKRFNYYYKISDYVNTLYDNNFQIEKIIEPQRKDRTILKGEIIKQNVPHDLIIISRLEKK